MYSILLLEAVVFLSDNHARSHKSCAAVDYTPISVELHEPTRGV